MKRLYRKIIITVLTLEARLLLRRKRPTIIAISGSVGKTSTKDAIYAAIKDTIPARKSQKSFNGEIGVPLTVLGLHNGWRNPLVWLWNVIDGAFVAVFTRDYPSVLVIETGVDAPGDMRAITNLIKPDVVVMTRLPDIPVHVEQFASPEAQNEEEFSLVKGLKANGVFVFNADDPVISAKLAEVRQTQVGFSRYADAAVTASAEQVFYRDDVPAGINFTVTAGDETAELSLPSAAGTQQLYAVTAAVAVAQHVGVSLQQAIAGLRSLTPPPGRMRLIPGIKGSVLIDDSYNSSPVAVEQALETVATITGRKRHIAVLGDMLELGKYSAAEHRRIGAQVARTCDLLLTVGVRARGFAEGALQAGMNEDQIRQYEKTDRTGRELQQLLQPGDLVLIKGSQSIRTERIVEEVMADPQAAEQLLARQDKVWKQTP